MECLDWLILIQSPNQQVCKFKGNIEKLDRQTFRIVTYSIPEKLNLKINDFHKKA